MKTRHIEMLTQEEKSTAAKTKVWTVWWELPDKSWEAVCLSESEADVEFQRRSADSIVQQWGKVGRGEGRTLLEWYDATSSAGSADECTKIVREVLGKVVDDKPGPVEMRTW